MKRAEEYPETDFRRRDPRFQGSNFDANVRAADTVRALATRRGARPGQLALAWLLHKGEDVAPIPGTKRRSYLEENVAAAAISLSPAEVAELGDGRYAVATIWGPIPVRLAPEGFEGRCGP